MHAAGDWDDAQARRSAAWHSNGSGGGGGGRGSGGGRSGGGVEAADEGTARVRMGSPQQRRIQVSTTADRGTASPKHTPKPELDMVPDDGSAGTFDVQVETRPATPPLHPVHHAHRAGSSTTSRPGSGKPQQQQQARPDTRDEVLDASLDAIDAVGGGGSVHHEQADSTASTTPKKQQLSSILSFLDEVDAKASEVVRSGAAVACKTMACGRVLTSVCVYGCVLLLHTASCVG